ncbi:hypothetical protein QIH80_28400 [Bradyrhizobium elkanii]|nr:hypothetical protein QIH80_28400 [Bradyrhizobium elkanii]
MNVERAGAGVADIQEVSAAQGRAGAGDDNVAVGAHIGADEGRVVADRAAVLDVEEAGADIADMKLLADEKR